MKEKLSKPAEKPEITLEQKAKLKKLEALANSDLRLNICLTNDFAFKKTFRNKKALTGLLSAVLEISPDCIVKLEFPDPILHGEYAQDREGILDVKVHLNDDTRINVEIQVRSYSFWEERSLFYLSKMYTEDFQKGMDFSQIEACIHISILGFDLVEAERFYSVIELRNRETGRIYSDKMSLRVVYLSKLEQASEDEKNTDVYRWARMISAKDWEVLRVMSEHNEYMKEAYEEMEKINADKALRYQYLREEMAASDETTIRNACFREGKKEGIEQGIAQGVEQGTAYGIERYSRLILKLTEDKRLEEIIKAASDPTVLQNLYTEYNI